MVEAKLLRKKLKNGLIVDKWDLVNIIEKQQAEIERLTTKNLEWLANWNEQQAEIEALKEKLDEAEQRYWNNNMKPNELADAVKSIYMGNPLAPTEFLMAIEATLRGQQSQIEILKIQISNLDLENIALNEQLESYLFK